MAFLHGLFGKSRDRKLAEFAGNACYSRLSISIAVKEAYPLLCALERAIIAETALKEPKVSKAAGDGLTLACPTCGEFNDEARDVALLGGQGGPFEQTRGVTFGGSTVAALGQGRCPGCKGQNVSATFDPQRAGIVWAEQHKYDDEIVQNARRCLLRATSRLVGRDDVTRLAEEERLRVQIDTARELLLEEYPRLRRKDVAGYVEQAFLGIGQQRDLESGLRTGRQRSSAAGPRLIRVALARAPSGDIGGTAAHG